MRRAFSIVSILAFTVPSLMAHAGSDWLDPPGKPVAGRVSRDANGIAQIRGTNDYDAFFLNGWIHAQDRLFQMDENRRTASGTLAELVGPAALPSDVQLRTLGLRRAAELSLLELTPRLRELLEAYAAGVNAWVAANPLPPEYALIEVTKFEPWTPLDSVVVLKLIVFSLSFEVDIDNTVTLLTYEAVGKAAGFDGTKLFFEDLSRSAPFDPASTIPDATASQAAVASTRTAGNKQAAWHASAQRAAAALNPAAVKLAKKWVKDLRRIPFFRQILDPNVRGASNVWAIAGKHTTTGNSMLANDPHLPLRMPSIFYPFALRGSNINAAGVGIPGVPLVVQGHNEKIAWGSTVNPLDVTDTYQEKIVPDPTAPAGLSSVHGTTLEHLLPVPQTFRTNNPANGTPDDVVVVPPSDTIPQATLIVGRRGAPLIAFDPATQAGISVQWIGQGATRELDTFLIFNEARNLSDFRRGLQFYDVGSQNWTYTDVAGNIAWFTSGEMPLRTDLDAGRIDGLPPMFIRDGISGANDWIRIAQRPTNQASFYRILPAAEMPRLVNPPSGWIINSNNDPVGTTLDNNPFNQLRPNGGIFYLSYLYSGFRAGRVTQLVRGKIDRGEKISFKDMKNFQADVALIDAQYFVPWITDAFANAGAPGHPGNALAANPAVASAVARLANWNFSTPTGIPEGYDGSDVDGVPSPAPMPGLSVPSAAEIQASVAATIYSVWRGQILKNTIGAVLSAGNLPPPGGSSTGSVPSQGGPLVVVALRNLLDNYSTRHGFGASGVQFFNVPGIPNTPETGAARRDVLILKSLADSLDLLASEEFAPAFGQSTNQNDYRWGKLHRIVFEHPFGGPFSVPPAGGAFPPPLANLRGIPVDGGFEVVDSSNHDPRAETLDGFMFNNGAVRRSVSEGTGNGIRAVSSLPGGASGVITSPLYINLLKPWLTNDTFTVKVQQPIGPGIQ